MIKNILNYTHRLGSLSIVSFPFIGLASAFATAYIKDSSYTVYSAPDIFMIWLSGILPLTIVPGIIIWCMNEFFPRMVRTTLFLFVVGVIFAFLVGVSIIVALAGI